MTIWQVLGGLPALGIEVAKSIEGVEGAEICTAELTTQLYGAATADAGPVQVTKAAPKGGRRLVKKKPDAPTEIS